MTSRVEVWNGGSWNQVWASAANACTNDTQWTQTSHDVTAYKNADVQVRWCLDIGSSRAFASGGWAIDDITLGALTCTGP
jgi:hypothetical protein